MTSILIVKQKIGILPLMRIHKIADVLFFIKYIKHPSGKFDILNFTIGTTRFAGSKLYPTTAHINPISYELLFLPFTDFAILCQ